MGGGIRTIPPVISNVRPRRGGLGRAVVVLLALLAVLLAPVASPSTAGADELDRLDAFGGVPDLGSPPAAPDRRLAGIAATPSGGGYWAVGTDGGIFSYGDAGFFGSTGGMALAKPIVGMAATPSGQGYWLVASDGGIFSFGDAGFFGSTGAMALNKPIVGMAATPSGQGYWLVASDGGIFSFGDAGFFGSTGGMTLNRPIVGMAAAPGGYGYWLVASDGGIFSFGWAKFHGSTGGITLNKPIVGMAAAPNGDGYWMVASDGGIFTFGVAPFHGSAGGVANAEPTVGMAVPPSGAGYWVLRSPLPPPPPRPRFDGPDVPGDSGSGRRIVYSNTQQRVWLVGDDGVVEHSWPVSGRRGVPPAGTYQVFSKSVWASAGHDGIYMNNMVRFARGSNLAIGFHAIPRYPNGRPLQSEDELGEYRSAGCVRQADDNAKILYDWAPIGTTVVVIYH